jgi:hypothetical protein
MPNFLCTEKFKSCNYKGCGVNSLRLNKIKRLLLLAQGIQIQIC